VFAPITIFVVSTIMFMMLTIFVQYEQRRGGRLLFVGMRNWADTNLVQANLWLKKQWRHFVRYILQLGWYYSLHSFLQTVMRVLVAVYDFLEAHFERNRLRTKHLRAEKHRKVNKHFAAVAEHKAEVALSPEEEKSLRQQKLEEKH
jgi:hypothetical protein